MEETLWAACSFETDLRSQAIHVLVKTSWVSNSMARDDSGGVPLYFVTSRKRNAAPPATPLVQNGGRFVSEVY